MPELALVIAIAVIGGVAGIGFGMLLSRGITRLDDGLARGEEADERDGDGRTTGR